jgi:dienelactone hydrolase
VIFLVETPIGAGRVVFHAAGSWFRRHARRITRLQSTKPDSVALALRRTFGDTTANRTAIDALSPLAQVASIRVPVFVAHGGEDWIVDVAQSKAFVAALKKRRMPHCTFFRPLEGHGFYNHRNRVRFYREIEIFLERHLAAPSRASN